jgi:AraC-like DNA-binding protein
VSAGQPPIPDQIPDAQPRRIRDADDANQPRRRRTGRPRKRVSARVVEQLAKAQLTNEEIARICNCSVDTLTRRFAERLKAWKSVGVGSARRELYRVGMSRDGAGKTSALIFFLKNYGNMRDNVAVTGANGGPLEYRNLTDEQLETEIRRLLAEAGYATPDGSPREARSSAERTGTPDATD